mmetsp:Transcript_37918/g.68281  ORF Transcript_37918/g.68281 Transcript_37918/m.68281 type:complete len:81 (-) Transcript_37918:395-637(-)|eukprot:CAMPEP_0201883980 /NCGR_PEP_ID=MMETSP0902-20130614/16340_1 /ASSEMBLY_ACC=CAM_ASM_000551 /TAXON_ID=420261 /ORGANISM="Thalassiosira antarctica, Strain CCMP982" /LENGTH=80 /DNA_ID=CAMNT_0048412853 /DNA_START=234 /DNA_END=476 /DNA_ORIENTATION=-
MTSDQAHRRGQQGTNNLPPLPSANTAKDEGEMRYGQLGEEQDHKFCTEANRKELLSQKLERLRALKDEIAKDEWMFDSKK